MDGSKESEIHGLHFKGSSNGAARFKISNFKNFWIFKDPQNDKLNSPNESFTQNYLMIFDF